MNYIPTRIQIKLTPEESRALAQVAQQERRDPRQQAALFVRRGLGLDGQIVTVSSVVAAALAQIAKNHGLNTVDEALEFLIFTNRYNQSRKATAEAVPQVAGA